ncbi:MAG TPA: site-2 protease family protein [Cyclobacteriaceae bacterium]|nr:site-2 protease family protein [Cyclobacteriaceae bacterium]
MYSRQEYFKHSLLFIITFIATTLAGGEWVYGRSILSSEKPLTWEYFLLSMQYSIPFIGILLIHELGHLLTSIYHKVRTSLPYFIPGWLGPFGFSIGTFGAVIQMKGFISSRRKFFDIGVAGPLAGFVVSFLVLCYGFTNLPPAEYLYEIHPEYADPDYVVPEGNIQLGYNLLFGLMERLLADESMMPNMAEVYHYPYLFAGYLALFFTALNLLPIGQLDGGHVVFGLFPRYHKQISLGAFICFLFYAGLGLISPFEELSYLLFALPLYTGFIYICFRKSNLSNESKWMIALLIVAAQYALVWLVPSAEGYSGWLLFAFLVGRVLGITHPDVIDNRSLSLQQKILGWMALVIFILCFTPQPIIIT